MKRTSKLRRTDAAAEPGKAGRLLRIRWGWLLTTVLWLAFITWKLPQFTFYVHRYTGAIYRSRLLLYYIPAGALLLQKAGLPMTAYDELLLEAAEAYPVCVQGGYADRELRFGGWGNEAEWPEMIRMLDYLRYNRLYGHEDRLPALDIPQI